MREEATESGVHRASFGRRSYFEWIYDRFGASNVRSKYPLPSRNRDARRDDPRPNGREGRRGAERRASVTRTRLRNRPTVVPIDSLADATRRLHRRLTHHHHGSPDTCDKQVAGRVQHRRRYRAAAAADRRSGHAG